MSPSPLSRGFNPWSLVVLASGLWILVLGAGPAGAHGQAVAGTGCDVPHFDRLTNLALSNGSRVSYFSGPVIVCGGGTRISADSAVVYEATNYTQLFRNVVFRDSDSRLTADQANYFSEEDRLRAWGNVVLNDLAAGSVIRGDTMVLIRSGSGPEGDRITVTGRRPRATLYPTRQPVAPGVEGALGDSLSPPIMTPDSGDAPVMTPDSGDAAVLVPDSGDAAVMTPDSGDAAVVVPDSGDAAAIQPDSAFLGPPGMTGPGPRPAAPPEERIPWEIDAQRIFLEGSRYFRATGEVNIHRDSVDAVADSVEYDGEAGSLFLSRDAGLNTADFDLTARDIRLDIPQDEIREIEARHEAFLEGEDLQLLAPTILMFLNEGELDQLVAIRDPVLDSLPEEILLQRPPHEGAQALGFSHFPLQPHAYSEEFLLWGDSIEVEAPENVLKQVKAMGRGRGESLTGDSLNTEGTPPLVRRDWLEGDTIIAIFSPTGASSEPGRGPDSLPEIPPPPARERGGASGSEADSSRYELDRLIAQGGARSLYRMSPADSAGAEEEGEESRLAIHYVVGDEITIFMAEGEVDRMEVKGQTRGIHLEPVKPERRRGGGTTSSGRPPGGGGP